MITARTSTRFFSVAALFLVLGVCTGASAWTRSTLTSVNVTVDLARQGDSRVVTEARFQIDGGSFHGFDLAPFQGASLVGTECVARMDNGLKLPLQIVEKADGSAKVLFADKQSLSAGSVMFTLVHRVDLAGIGAVREYAGRARFDWTPLIWEQGMESMSVAINLPGESRDAAIVADEAISIDYEKVTRANGISFKKFRASRWYPMQVLIDFDASLVDLSAAMPEEQKPVDMEVSTASVIPQYETRAQVQAPIGVNAFPAAVALIGLLFMILKSRNVRLVHRDLNLPDGFRFLEHTGSAIRLVLSLGAVGLGLFAQWKGAIAASVPAFCAAAALWIPARRKGVTRPRAGGEWRLMSDVDLHQYRALSRTYQARRHSFLDISTVLGFAAFLVAVAALVCTAWSIHGEWPRTAFAILLNGLIWMVPSWFSFNRSELPVDFAVESFRALQGWRKGLVKLVGHLTQDASAAFWVREDEDGPIEVRLRVAPPPSKLIGLEIAVEVIASGAAYRVRKVTVLRVEPGTEMARRLATCPNAVEHHLSPDLEEEIIVLRNRRGNRDAGLRPLKTALALI